MDFSPSFIPEHNKPDSPGVWMNFDNSVSIYMVVTHTMTFADAAQSAFDLLQNAQDRFPDWPRSFYLDIEGHRHPEHGFLDDWIEFQQEFWFSTLAPFLTSFDLPLTGPLLNPETQKNNIPDSLAIH